MASVTRRVRIGQRSGRATICNSPFPSFSFVPRSERRADPAGRHLPTGITSDDCAALVTDCVSSARTSEAAIPRIRRQGADQDRGFNTHCASVTRPHDRRMTASMPLPLRGADIAMLVAHRGPSAKACWRGPRFIVRFGQFRREAPADYSISVNNKRVSSRFQDAKTEIWKIPN